MKTHIPLIVFLLSIVLGACRNEDSDYSQNYIAHGGGEFEGVEISNSCEAVVNSLENGIKFVELDLALTTDSALVATHDWKTFREQAHYYPITDEPLSKEEFLRSKIEGRLTPLAVEDIVDLMKEYPHFTLVTDKISDYKLIDKYFKDYSHRVMVECFSTEDYSRLTEMGYKCFVSATPPPYYKALIKNMAVWIHRFPTAYASSIESFCEGNESNALLKPYPYETALFTAKNRQEADSLFHLYPNVSFIYIDNIEIQ